MKLVLYTYQSIEAVEALKKNGVLRLTKEDKNLTHIHRFEGSNFEYAYEFIIYEMNKRLDSPQYKDTYYPIWAWNKWEGENPPTEFLDEIHKGSIRLKIEIDSSRILLSDFDMFSFLLAGGLCFTYNDRQKQRYENAWKNPDEYFYPNLEQMFTLHRKRSTQYAFSYKKETIQATFWELFLEDVIEYKQV